MRLFNKIQWLEKILSLARASASNNVELAEAIAEYDRLKKEDQEEKIKWLEAHGETCLSCYQKFHPNNPNWPFCSIGCKYSE